MTKSVSRRAIKAYFYTLLNSVKILYFCACLVIMLVPGLGQRVCPTSCSCVLTASGGQAVSCTQSLPDYPKGLPTNTEVVSLAPLPGQAPNSITSVTAADFVTTKNLTRLTIRRSSLQRIGPSAFLNMKRLLSLDLRDNKLARLSKSDLMGLSALVSLDISDNKGCGLDADIFQDLSGLRILRMSNIGLYTLEKILAPLTSLSYLDIHGNNLFRVRGYNLAMLRNLRHLDLSGNDLYGVDEDVRPVLASLAALDLDSNPWRCNCALSWLKSLPRKFVAPSGGGRMPVVCGQPTRLLYRDVWDVADLQMTCSPAVITSCSGPVTVREGDQISISCDVQGDPFPDVTWSRPDGVQVQTDFTFATADTSTLVGITADYLLHHGSWQVNAVSYNTTATVSLLVTVLRVTTHTTDVTTSLSRNPRNNQGQPSSRPLTGRTNSILGGSNTYSTRPRAPSLPQGLTHASFPTFTRVSGNSLVSFTITPKTEKGITHAHSGDGSHDSNKDVGNTDPNNGINNNGGKINQTIITLAAIISGAVVCMVGMTVFAVTVYKIRQRRQIHARQRRTSAELYRYNGNRQHTTTNNNNRTNGDIVYFLRPSSTTSTEARHISTLFGPR